MGERAILLARGLACARCGPPTPGLCINRPGLVLTCVRLFARAYQLYYSIFFSYQTNISWTYQFRNQRANLLMVVCVLVCYLWWLVCCCLQRRSQDFYMGYAEPIISYANREKPFSNSVKFHKNCPTIQYTTTKWHNKS